MMLEDNERINGLAVNGVTVLQLLLEKGVFTIEEFNKTQIRAQASVDQIIAKKTDDFLASKEGQNYLTIQLLPPQYRDPDVAERLE